MMACPKQSQHNGRMATEAVLETGRKDDLLERIMTSSLT
jgi:hypothetical protein